MEQPLSFCTPEFAEITSKVANYIVVNLKVKDVIYSHKFSANIIMSNDVTRNF